MAFTLTPALGDDFVGRDEITSEIVSRLSSKNRIGYSLSGVRRVGKTSILKEVSRRLSENSKIPVAYVSVWRVSPNTVDEFVKVTTRAVLAAFHDRLPMKFKFEELLATGKVALTRFLQNLKLSAKVASDLEVAISYVRKETDDVDAAISGCLLLLEHLGEMTKTVSVLIIDEFPSLIDLTYGSRNQKIGDSIIKLVRTLYEDFRHTKLVISGSYRQTLKNLVAKQKAPFYKQLLIREVDPFTKEDYLRFIRHYLPSLKFTDAGSEEEFYRVTGGIPYNLQLLGNEMQFQRITRLDHATLSDLVQTVLRKEGELTFKEFIVDLTPSEVKVLKALAKSPSSKPSEIATEQFMDKDTVGSSLNLLTKKGILSRGGRGSYRFTDNLFSEWLRISE